jgi:hypothetical protein
VNFELTAFWEVRDGFSSLIHRRLLAWMRCAILLSTNLTRAPRRREKGKPAARRGRKALGPLQHTAAARLPNGGGGAIANPRE